jgi:hypothetical protein
MEASLSLTQKIGAAAQGFMTRRVWAWPGSTEDGDEIKINSAELTGTSISMALHGFLV